MVALWSKIGILGILSCFVGILATGFGFEGQLSPPVPPDKPLSSSPAYNGGPDGILQDTVVAALVKSWGYWDYLLWEDLNLNWSQYGETPVSIDTTLLNKDGFSYEDLALIGADVVIISDPSGAWKTFSQEEIEALSQYAQSGHNLLGTYLVFYYPYGDTAIDNRGLAPVFGFDSSMAYSLRGIDRRYRFNQGEYVFEGMENPYKSQGYNLSQVTENGAWSGGDLLAGRVAAATADSLGIVTFYPAGNYVAIYISSMPEYGGGETDRQFLYNAISYQGPSDVDEPADSVFPREFVLLQNYPNPFNLSTIFEYHLPRDCEVTLEVLNLLGQRVALVIRERQSGGLKVAGWDRHSLSSGTYFYRLRAGNQVSVKPMVILK